MMAQVIVIGRRYLLHSTLNLISITSAIMFLRTYALYNRSKLVLAVLLIAAGVAFAVITICRIFFPVIRYTFITALHSGVSLVSTPVQYRAKQTKWVVKSRHHKKRAFT